ncbi:MAG TPA: diguanylate cyclase, partial [Chroococcidiopsis sp.]
GDRCLYQVAQAIQQATKRPADLVARYGGEEFAIVLPNTLAKGAIYVAQQIRANVKQLSIDHALSPLDSQISISLGVATMIPNHHQSPADLLSIADQALYQAKASGRDCICLATS